MGIFRPRKRWVFDVAYPDPDPRPAPDGSILYRFYMFDCDGNGFPSEGSFKLVRTTEKLKGGYQDHRTLEDMIGGCCPPQLMKDFIMQEGGEMVARDPVEEAIKLHKRGYFGGGD